MAGYFDDPANAYTATGISTPNQTGLTTGTTDTSGLGSLMTPFSGTYNAPSTPTYQNFSPSAFNGPAAYTKPADFMAPTAEQAAATPGYQFQLQQGLNAAQNSAAAHGNLLTGATAKGLNDYAQGMASTNYQNTYQNALNAYNTNFNAGMQTQNQAYNQAYQPWLASNQLGQNATTANNAAATQGFQNQQANALNAYNTAYQTNQYNQQTPYNMLMGVAQLGSQNANNSANLGANYASSYGNLVGSNANSIANLYGQQGNANAAGQVGSSNAWNSAFGSIGNAAMGSYYASQNPYQAQNPNANAFNLQAYQ